MLSIVRDPSRPLERETLSPNATGYGGEWIPNVVPSHLGGVAAVICTRMKYAAAWNVSVTVRHSIDSKHRESRIILSAFRELQGTQDLRGER